MRHLPLLCTLLAFTALGDAPSALPSSSASAPETPLASLPYTRGLEPSFMDKAVDPCVDFYAYSCGGWLKANPIPADQTSWSVYAKLGNEIKRHLWALLLEAGKPGPAKSEEEKKAGDYFASCMDLPAVDALGAAPLQPALKALAELKDSASLARWLAAQHLATASADLLFGFTSEQDASDSSQFIAAVYAGGLGLPDRDDYLRKDPKSVEQRGRYLAHVQRMLELGGDDPALARATAASVMRVETELAKASLTRVERRTPRNVFHKLPLARLKALAPAFDWDAYLAASGVPSTSVLDVSQPKFVTRVSQLLRQEPLDLWKGYLRWHLINGAAPHLSQPFVDADFEFYQKYLLGSEVLAPRWKRCVESVDENLGEALGQLFVKKNFSPELKSQARAMVLVIQKEMEKELQSLEWMSPATKEAAFAKLKSMADKIGYPDKWRDYSSVVVDRKDFFGNVTRATGFETARKLRKIGQPVDRGEWLENPQSVNAYYDPVMNDMNFMAAVLQPPLYDPKMDLAPNYGNTGQTVGHELVHGFDDEGRQFDEKGTLRDWWSKKDAKQFDQRVKCVADQYSGYIAVDEVYVNGELTLGENVADLGGIILAYRGWKTVTAGKELSAADGLTPEQRFFVGNAQWVCSNVRPATERLRARTNPHAPGKYRVNGLFVNMPEFAAAFACKAGQPMVKPASKVCRIW